MLRLTRLVSLTLIALLSACTHPNTSYRLLSDEVISRVKSPPYSLLQVRRAQESLRWRLTHKLRGVQVESELKNFACLIVKQSLDPTSATGERAPTMIPCVGNPKRKCAHACKRMRLPHELKLPSEYEQVAQEHDKLLWEDLKALKGYTAPRAPEHYLERCLVCEHAVQVKTMICQRDLAGLDLMSERVMYSPIDQWLNQCSDVPDATLQALIRYRSDSLKPPERLPYPHIIDGLPDELQAKLSALAALGQGIRLARGPLDIPRIESLLSSEDIERIEAPEWDKTQDTLKRRVDVAVLPCLDQGFERCLDPDLIRDTRERARRYLSACHLCEYATEVGSWLATLSLSREPVWMSHEPNTQALLRRSSPAALVIRERDQLTRLTLEPELNLSSRAQWVTPLTYDQSARLTPSTLTLWRPQSLWSGRARKPAPQLILSDARQVYAVTPKDGIVRWSQRAPINAEGRAEPCGRLDALPPMRLSELAQGGAVCTRADSLVFWDHLGAPILKLKCDGECGSVITLASTLSQTDASSQTGSTPKGAQTLVMTRPNTDADGRAEAGLHSRDERSVSLVYYDLTPPDEAREAQTATARRGAERMLGEPLLKPERWLSIQDVSAHLPPDAPSSLLTMSEQRGRYAVHLISAHDGREFWRVNLKRERPLYQPSVRVIPGTGNTSPDHIIGLLTRSRFIMIDLTRGEVKRSDRIPTRAKLTPVIRREAASHSAEWGRFHDKLLILHPINRALYVARGAGPLKRALSTPRVELDARLQALDEQWVITSPRAGQVIGVTSDGAGIAWRWSSAPFDSIALSPHWSMVSRAGQLELSRVAPTGALPLYTERPALTESACALGDRWSCLFEGDALIGILAPESNATSGDESKRELSPKRLRAHRARLMRWFTRQLERSRSAPLKLPEHAQIIQRWHLACRWGIARACTQLGMLTELGVSDTNTSDANLSNGVDSEMGDVTQQSEGRERAETQSSKTELRTGALRRFERAREYYRLGESLGDALSSARLGALNEDGRGGPRDYKRARRAHLDACEDDIIESCARWARLTELGLGGPQRLAAARGAYHSACQGGIKWACERLESSP